MDNLQGSMNPCLLEEELGMGGCLEEENGTLYMTQFLSNTQDFEQRNEAHDILLPSLDDKMPFLQMLQGVESHHYYYQQHIENPFYPLMQQPMVMKPFNESTFPSCLADGELDSCVTNNNDIIMDLQSSPTAPQISTIDHSNVEKSTPKSSTTRCKGKRSQMVGPTKEKRKRIRTTTKPASKTKEEAETQRMTHIAVERNRRKQMNQHLNALRSLMPPSYVQRGDQASIVGGAIDFVKELEQVLQWQEAQKRMRQYEDQNGDVSGSSTTSSPPNSSISALQYKYANGNNGDESSVEGGKLRAENRSELADIQVMVIQNHVNLKIRCQRRKGQLLSLILALEQLSFTLLHLNITSMHSFAYYSFNLEIEEECKVGSAEEVASVIHQIFRLINSS